MDVHPTKNVSIGIDPYPNLSTWLHLVHCHGFRAADVAADGDTLHHSTVPKEGRFMASPLAVARRCQTGATGLVISQRLGEP